MQMRWLVAVSMAIVCGHAVSAQVSPRRTNIPIPFRTYVAFNPLLVPFDIGSVEMETGVAQGVTLGGVGSYTNVDKQRYSSFDLDVRYYPGEVVLRGFSVGLSGGFLRYTNHVGTPETRTSIDAPTVGVLADYNWMLGVNRRFLVGTGLGAKRVLAGRKERDETGLGRAYMTLRFVIGYAF